MVAIDAILEVFSAKRALRPKYRRLFETITQCVTRGVVGPGELIPSERELAEKLGISRVTVRKAFAVLLEDGVLERRHGAGTFVAKSIEKSLFSISSFSEDMVKYRLTPRSKTVEVKRLAPDAHLDLIFGLGAGQEVVQIQRVRFANDLAIAYEVVLVPESVLPDADNIGESLYQDMAQAGCRPSSAVQRIKAISANKAQAAMLDIPLHAAILHIERHGVIADGRVVEYTNSYYRADSYVFVTKSQI